VPVQLAAVFAHDVLPCKPVSASPVSPAWARWPCSKADSARAALYKGECLSPSNGVS
jgi:hypothetical protein